ncbi:hypothetical protein NDU88_010050, partial [Pleurodeles waltl]
VSSLLRHTPRGVCSANNSSSDEESCPWDPRLREADTATCVKLGLNTDPLSQGLV